MFSRTTRARSTDVSRVIRAGTTVHSPLFSVRMLKNDLKEPKYSCIVSKKVVATAVGRNTLKRKMREALKTLPQSGQTVIVYAKKGAAELSVRAIRSELVTLL